MKKIPYKVINANTRLTDFKETKEMVLAAALSPVDKDKLENLEKSRRKSQGKKR